MAVHAGNGTLEYDAAGFQSHVALLRTLEHDVEQSLHRLQVEISRMPEFWKGGSGGSAAQAAEKIKHAGDLVREAIGAHGQAVQRAHQAFEEGDQAVQRFFAQQT